MTNIQHITDAKDTKVCQREIKDNWVGPGQWTLSLAKNSTCIQPERLYNTNINNKFFKSIQTAQVLACACGEGVVSIYFFFFSLCFGFVLLLSLGFWCRIPSKQSLLQSHRAFPCATSVRLLFGGWQSTGGRGPATPGGSRMITHTVLVFMCLVVNESPLNYF